MAASTSAVNSKLKTLAFNMAILVTFLIYMFPTLIMNGIIRNQFLLGDPLYTSRIKIAKVQPFNLGLNFIPEPNSPSDREILSLGETIIGGIGKFLNLNISQTYIYSTVFIAGIILVIFSKIITNTNYKMATLISAVTIFLFWGPRNNFNLSRPISPQISILLYLGVILLIKKSLMYKNYSTRIYLGILAGTSAYLSSPYTLVIVSFAFFSYLSINIYKKDVKKYDLISFLLFLIIVTPYIFYNLQIKRENTFQELLLRQGLIESNLPAASKTIFVALFAICYILLYVRNAKCKKILENNILIKYILVQAIAIAIISNSNMFTGKALQFSNHFDHFSKVLLILVLGLTIDALTENNLWQKNRIEGTTFKKIIRPIAVLLIPIIFIIGIKDLKELQSSEIKGLGILSWIQMNLGKDDKLLFSDVGISASASVILPNQLFFTPDLFNYNYSQREINFRYFATTACTEKEINEKSWGFTYGLRGIDKIGKVNRYISYTDRFHLGNFFDKYLISQRKFEKNNYALLLEMSKNDADQIGNIGCINFIKSRGVKYIISNNKQLWNSYSSEDLISNVKEIDSTFIYKVN